MPKITPAWEREEQNKWAETQWKMEREGKKLEPTGRTWGNSQGTTVEYSPVSNEDETDSAVKYDDDSKEGDTGEALAKKYSFPQKEKKWWQFWR